MKKYILLIICFLFSISLKAQTYRPFPTENAFWRHFICETPCYNPKYFHYAIKGDTTINSLLYHQLWHSDNTYRCAFREDIANKKVYIIDTGQVEEKLLYDFDLKVGDNVSHFVDPTYFWDLKVVQIDSVLLGDNLYHKRFRLNDYFKLPSGFHLIEGIGVIEPGLLWEFLYDPGMNVVGGLICVNINGNTVFPRGGTCNPALEYRPFPTENAIWRSSTKRYNPSNGQLSEFLDCHYAITGDTVINGKTYHLLQKNQLNRITNIFSKSHIGAFREDVTNKKIYIYDFNNNTERLLYDFDLKTGSNVSHFINGGEGAIPIVTHIDSIMLRDGLYHKRFHITGCYDLKKYLIEGIGDCNGLFSLNFNCSGYDEEFLHCVKLNDQLVYSIQDCYPNHGIGSYPCNYVTDSVGISERIAENKFLIYPNPTNGMINVQCLMINVQNIEIFDVFGRKVFEQKAESAKAEASQISQSQISHQAVDLSNAPTGIYFIRITTENGIINTKIIKY